MKKSTRAVKKAAKKVATRRSTAKRRTVKKIAPKKSSAGKRKAISLIALNTVTVAGAGMNLSRYNIIPANVDMVIGSVTIDFEHEIVLTGVDSADTFRVDFVQTPETCNWEINGSLTRRFNVSQVGTKRFSDRLAFKLRTGKTRIKNERFVVQADGYLTSKPNSKIRASIRVTVK